MALDPATWTASGIAAAEAVVIAGLVVRRRHTEHGRRITVMFGYRGPDTVDETDAVHDDGAPT